MDQNRVGQKESVPSAASDSNVEPQPGLETTPQRSLLPSLQLPRGGGALRGLGEKFAANPVTGSGSITLPIATSPGRSGFGPELALTYDSASGNGPFGFGWSLSTPAITRKTDKGLPQYRDAEESDVYIFSGVEDLVPVLAADGARFEDDTTAPGYVIHRYRPRLEGLFARIERWTHLASGEIHWRSISGDQVTSIYGPDNGSRIVDPADPSPNQPRRIFSWLLAETFDDKGNAMVYEYVAENQDGVNPTLANERNRVHTANRYLKRIKYGNRVSRRAEPDLSLAQWLFEVVFDYDEGHCEVLPLDASVAEDAQHRYRRASPQPPGPWAMRPDPFSSYRAGFEIRTSRRCRRILMFHHFEELATEPCLVRSTDFGYADFDAATSTSIDEELAHQGSTRIASFLRSVKERGYVRNPAAPVVLEQGIPFVTYLEKSLPALEFEYSKAHLQEEIRELEESSRENLPVGLDNAQYQWVDLDGEGISGILTEQAGAWFYKPNLGEGRFGALQTVAAKPSFADLSSGRQQLIDLAGDGQLDLVHLNPPLAGFYERTKEKGWQTFQPFLQLPNLPWDDPNLRFVDLTGDGHADLLVTEHQVLTWYPSLQEEGFGQAHQQAKPWDEEAGPRLVLADGEQSIYLADMSGDGLTDLVRLRNGEICYWPNQGYGLFGSKITMDSAPLFDHPEQFDQRRVRLADLDGSGTHDVLYFGHDGLRLYFNLAGNGWSTARPVPAFPRLDNLSSVQVIDLKGSGTASLVWSSPLPGGGRSALRYIDLLGGQKPHLLTRSVNNLGAETRIDYAPSTKFYLADQSAGRPWLTRLPFPVQVVERVEVSDRVSRNRLVSLYAYHHGDFDGEEREFRGFGMVEQWDTEELGLLTADGTLPTAAEAASHLPPVHTKTWFHTGAYLGRDRISNFFAGLLDAQDVGEYFREPGLSDAEALALLLPDTVLPPGLSVQEEREACRALRGAELRQEVYALDGTPKAEFPYTVSEQNFTLRQVQPRAGNRHGVFFAHGRETLTFHYERNPTDPRLQHAITLEVDDFGNVLKEVSIGYGRRQDDPTLPLQVDRDQQTRPLLTYSENRFTQAIDQASAYRHPLPAESLTYELTGFEPENNAVRFRFEEWARNGFDLLASAAEIPYQQTADNVARQKRLVEAVRTLYRKDDLSALLPLGEAEALALPGESYQLAMTSGLLAQVLKRDGQDLLPNPATVLAGGTAGQGGYVVSQALKASGHFPNTDPDDHWWAPGGRVFLSPESTHSAGQEEAYARDHFFLPHRERDPFHSAAVSTESSIRYDAYDLLVLETRDALDNRITVGERLPQGDLDPTRPGNDYRVLQPRSVMDPNRNRTQIAFDALGMVVGTAVLGKPEENLGDTLDGFEADLIPSVQAAHLADPLNTPEALLGRATTRLVYDLFAYQRAQDQPTPPPMVIYTLVRETHHSDLEPGQQTRIQHSLTYSDGFGREIQKKIQAEPGPVVEGGAVVASRWVGSGWTIYNNKGLPVRRYEPFWSLTHHFELGVEVGVSPILFYDPTGRMIATLHPNQTYEKVVFDPWHQTTWDVNDTVLSDPRNDADIAGFTAGFFAGLPANPPWQTWHSARQGGALGPREQACAAQTASHADTPSQIHFDTLGRPFLTLADNGPDPAQPSQRMRIASRVALDIEGNERTVRDAIEQDGEASGRVVMRYIYDLLGQRIHWQSMEAGARWTLHNVAGQVIRQWDSRGHTTRTDHDPLQRPLRTWVTGAHPTNPAEELLTERFVYGEQHPEAEARNLRGALYFHVDQAGAVSNEVQDMKGNPLHATRRIATEYKQTFSWSAVDAALPAANTAFDPALLEATLAPLLESDVFTTLTTVDALSRPRTLTTPHTPTMQPSVLRPGYNEANLLERVDANLHGAVLNGQPVWTPFVTNIDYDAKGQRQRIDYGNGVSTLYHYDALTFRLVHLLTRRNAIAFPGDCPQPSAVGWPGCQVQSLSYTYDPVGNITHLRDDAQQAIYFRNQRVEPSAEYTYDAVYRLVQATGREHLGQNGVPSVHSADDASRTGIAWAANDGNAMGTYVEEYLYDAVGNLLEMQHRGSAPTQPGWTRTYAYEEASALEPAKSSNRLSRTTVGSGNPVTERYVYDTHGNIARMPHLGGAHPAPNMHWDPQNRLRQTDLGGGGTAYFTYDATGQRVRKVWEKSAQLVEERIYLGSIELYRRRQGAERFERQTLHLMDDERRIALVETRTLDTAGTDSAPPQLIRYQFDNHLGSSNLELDEQAQIISYEENTPFGSTSYQAVRSQTETPKRYRFTGKERDQESGFYFHGARYYAPWLGRWMSPDPAHFIDGTNLYAYVGNSPTRFSDPSGLGKKEQGLGAKMEAASKKHQEAANKVRGQTGRKEIKVDRQVRVGRQKTVIPDEVKTTPGGKQSVVETKARHVNSKRNATPAQRKADIKASLNQAKEQLVELEQAKKVGPEAKNKVLRVAHDSDGGKSSTKALPQWKQEAKEARKQWVNAAKDPAEKALRERVNVTTTTRDRFKKATDALEAAAKKNKRLLRAGKKLAKAGRHLTAAVPIAGIVIGHASAAHAASEGDLSGAALDEFGHVPVVGDAVDAFRGGYALGEAATEILPIEEAAVSAGQEAEALARSLGAGDTTATVVGATAAAAGAVGEFLAWTNPVTATGKLLSLF